MRLFYILLGKLLCLYEKAQPIKEHKTLKLKECICISIKPIHLQWNKQKWDYDNNFVHNTIKRIKYSNLAKRSIKRILRW